MIPPITVVVAISVDIFKAMKTPPTNMLNNSKNEAPIKLGMNSYELEYGIDSYFKRREV